MSAVGRRLRVAVEELRRAAAARGHGGGRSVQRLTGVAYEAMQLPWGRSGGPVAALLAASLQLRGAVVGVVWSVVRMGVVVGVGRSVAEAILSDCVWGSALKAWSIQGWVGPPPPTVMLRRFVVIGPAVRVLVCATVLPLSFLFLSILGGPG